MSFVEDIAYAYVGKNGENQNTGQNQSQEQSQSVGGQPQQAASAGAAPVNQGQTPAANQTATQTANPMESDGFMGFEAFGGNNLFQE